MNELNEKDLELVVIKQELGELETNALSIKEKVIEVLPNYGIDNYDESNIDVAIKDRALLNKSKKALNDKRIELEKKFNEPFTNFKTIIKETIDLIDEASSKIDSVIKESEEREKSKRKDIIISIFNENVKELKDVLSLEKIFDNKWLNKGSFNDNGTFKLKDELINKINKIRNDLIAISDLKSKYEVELKNDYLNYFDLGAVITKNNELMKKEELLNIQKDETAKEIEIQKVEKMQEIANTKVQEKITDDILTYTLKITGKTSQMKALRTFLETNEMPFEKVA